MSKCVWDGVLEPKRQGRRLRQGFRWQTPYTFRDRFAQITDDVFPLSKLSNIAVTHEIVNCGLEHLPEIRIFVSSVRETCGLFFRLIGHTDL